MMARTPHALAFTLVALACGPAAAPGGTTAGTTGGTASSGGNANPGGARATTPAAGGGSGSGTFGSFTTRNLEIRPDGSVALGPGFAPTPVVLAGANGGPTDAYSLGSSIGASCVGYIPAEPQHVIEVTAPISYLRIVVDTYRPSDAAGSYGSIDSTLFVRLPGGAVWCDDDGGGDLQPLVSGPVLPGRLEIFVGAYSSSGVGARYKLAITESAAYTHDDLR